MLGPYTQQGYFFSSLFLPFPISSLACSVLLYLSVSRLAVQSVLYFSAPHSLSLWHRGTAGRDCMCQTSDRGVGRAPSQPDHTLCDVRDTRAGPPPALDLQTPHQIFLPLSHRIDSHSPPSGALIRHQQHPASWTNSPGRPSHRPSPTTTTSQWAWMMASACCPTIGSRTSGECPAFFFR